MIFDSNYENIVDDYYHLLLNNKPADEHVNTLWKALCFAAERRCGASASRFSVCISTHALRRVKDAETCRSPAWICDLPEYAWRRFDEENLSGKQHCAVGRLPFHTGVR